MIGRLFHVTVPPAVFNGADMIRVVDVKKYTLIEGNDIDLYVICRVSKEEQFFGEEKIKMDDFCKLLSGGILLDPEPYTAAKILLQGNKI